ncbi:MAG: hypothetical protein HQL65_05305 [Magnetococcales bacterium]|nr:hypothetical protein [Magnetococcales bacterium]
MVIRGTILQPWNWHTPKLDREGKCLYQRLQRDANRIWEQGFTAVWLPPASEGSGGEQDVGYGIKNWYSLDCTKYGPKQELQSAALTLRDRGISVYHDQVFNHLMGGDYEKDIACMHVKCDNRSEPLNSDSTWFKADVPTDFPWLQLNHEHFDAYHPNDHDCWILRGKKFDTDTSQDSLMGCDLDFQCGDLIIKLDHFGQWFKYEIHSDGYRFDAVKHISTHGILNFLTSMRRSARRNLFAVGEFKGDLGGLKWYIEQTQGQISLFDFPLQWKLVEASQKKELPHRFDMGSIFDNTLTRSNPVLSVPFVHSHDDQPPVHGKEQRGGYVGDWFISQAYALILLRDEGYPMVADVDMLRHGAMIQRYMLARRHCTFGSRYDRFDHPATIGWAFTGDQGYDNSMAVVLSNGDYGQKWLPTYRPHVRYRDLTQSLQHTIVTNEYGWAEFQCPSQNTSVWVEETKFDNLAPFF